MTAAMRELPSSRGADAVYFRPRRLGHVNIYVTDVDRSMDFYVNILGLQESYRQPLSKAGFVGNGNTHHDIGMVDINGPLSRGRKNAGLNHLAFELETEVDLVEGYRRAIANDVKFAFTMDHDIAHSVYGLDPDGNRYEIYADVVFDWKAARHGVVTKPKPNWAPGTTVPTTERNYHVNPPILRVENAIFHPTRIVHATLAVEHYEQTFTYYTRIIGLTPLFGSASTAFSVLGGTCGERNLTLCRATGGRRPGLHHMGFQVADSAALRGSLERLRGAGLDPVAEIDHPTRHSVFVRDPDGLLVQFFVDHPKPIEALADLSEDIAAYVA